MKSLKTLTMILVVAIAAIACSKKKGGGGAVVAAQTYYLSNGTCYQRSNNGRVDLNLCDNVSYHFYNNGCYDSSKKYADMSNCTGLVDRYYYFNGRCCDKDNGSRYVDDQYCTDSNYNGGGYNNGGNNGGGYNNGGNYGNQCYGVYSYIDRGYFHLVNCNRDNNYCSGYQLTEVNSGRTVYCQ